MVALVWTDGCIASYASFAYMEIQMYRNNIKIGGRYSDLTEFSTEMSGYLAAPHIRIGAHEGILH